MLLYVVFAINIEKLKSMQWNGKSIKLFVFGDYAFLCNIYGLSGAKGRYPCLWCLITQVEIQRVLQDPVEDRTLNSIRNNYNKYVEKGDNLANAKFCYNCIRSPLMNIDIENVVPMYLHILLGSTQTPQLA